MRQRKLGVVAAVLAAVSVICFLTNVDHFERYDFGGRLEVYFPVNYQVAGGESLVTRTDLRERGLAGDPASTYRWCYLGEAYAEAKLGEKAEQCMERAVELGGHLPQVLLRAANVNLVDGRREAALAQSARVLRVTGEFDEIVFTNYRRFQVPVGMVVRTGLPEDDRVYESYFKHTLQHGTPEQAEWIWDALGERKQQTGSLAGRYSEYLIGQGMNDRAVAIWATNREGLEGEYGRLEHVWNGGFEADPIDAPLDWRWRNGQGVRVSRDREASREGSYALRVEFDGSRNVNFSQVWQQSWLPGGQYVLSAWAKAEGLTTDQGVYVGVRGEAGGARRARTEAVRGSVEWTRLEAALTVKARGEMVRIEVRRDESLRIENKISGRVWIDGVSVRRVEGGG